MSMPGAVFLHDRNPDLHHSVEVESIVTYLKAAGDRIENEPVDKVSAYLGFLANHARADNQGDELSDVDYQIESAIISREAFPNRYFLIRQNWQAGRGLGRIALSQKERDKQITHVRQDQASRLRDWAFHLFGAEDPADREWMPPPYPTWFGEYVFSAVTGLADYDKRKGAFRQRSKTTTANFPDFNEAALKAVFNVVSTKADALSVLRTNKHLPKDQQSRLTKAQKAALNGPSDFNTLYSRAFREALSGYPTAKELKTTKGEWRTFRQSADPHDVQELLSALEGRGTGWCTVNTADAERHLAGGDFYAYFTSNKHGVACIPRLAIRMDQGVVKDVAGIIGQEYGQQRPNLDQRIESRLLPVVTKKLAELPGGEVHLQRLTDQKQLDGLERRLRSESDAKLTDEEILFLYEMVRDVGSFGLQRDERIDDLRESHASTGGKYDTERLLPYSLERQFEHSFKAYHDVVNGINRRRRDNFIEPWSLAQCTALFEKKAAHWKKAYLYGLMYDQLTNYNTPYRLLLTPNVPISNLEILGLATDFNGEEPHDSEALYRYARQAKQRIQWSGMTNADEPVRISLMPAKYDAAMGVEEIDSQKFSYQNKLHSQEYEYPDLEFRIPSILEAVTYWHVLRRQGFFVQETHTLEERTAIWHLDLSRNTRYGFSAAPYSRLSTGHTSTLERTTMGPVRLSVS